MKDKADLDKLLTASDQPTIQGYNKGISAATNSIEDQLPAIKW